MDSILHTPIATRKRMLYRTGMRNTAAELEGFLNDLAASAEAGDRLPTERELMESFQCSKGSAREALKALEVEGLVSTRTGPSGGAYLKFYL